MTDAINEKTIGVVGGLGPYAGIDLVSKIFDQTKATVDQEHLSVVLWSSPREVVDRTSFLLGEVSENPAYSIARIIHSLEQCGATVAGIPCYTAHMPPIMDVVLAELKRLSCSVNLLNMIEEVESYIRDRHPNVRRTGLLCTTGTYRTMHQSSRQFKALDMILPDEQVQASVQDAIYNRTYGIKAQSTPPSEPVRHILREVVHHLQSKGVDAIVLGCTEIPLVITKQSMQGTIMIDPTFVLARALIREANPGKLRPL